MTIQNNIQTIQASIESLLDSEDIHVSTEVGDELVAISSSLHEVVEDINRHNHENTFDERHLAAVLTGLRLLQAELPYDGSLPHGVSMIFDGEGSLTPLTEDEIDEICISINENGISIL